MRSVTDKHDTLARLARSEIVSLRYHRHRPFLADIRQQAFARYVRHYWPRSAAEGPPHPEEDSPAARAFSRMLTLLANARLTINFDCCAWFRPGPGPRTERYGPAYPAALDAEAHDTLETRIGGLGHKRHLPGVRHAWHVQDRIADYGVRASPLFRPALRPHYAVLDFAHYPGGGYCNAGESFLILKDHLKLNATYLPTLAPMVETDLKARHAEYGTRLPGLDDVVSTHLDLERLLLYCPPVLLDALHRLARTPGDVGLWDSGQIGHHCIEAHLYADIELRRDVQRAVISLDEVRKGPERARLYGRTPCRDKPGWSDRDFRTTLKNLERFARRHRIPLEFV